MAHHFNDNVYTKYFTPREYQVELLDIARARNIVVCLGTGPAKIFIASKLIIELARDVRKKKGKYTLFVADTPIMVSHMTTYIRHLTDLSVGGYTKWDPTCKDKIADQQVLVMTPQTCVSALQFRQLNLSDVNLLIVDQCQHAIEPDCHMHELMKIYDSLRGHHPRVLGLTPPLFSTGCDPKRLEWELHRLEQALHSKVETASDIVSVLRFCPRPAERLLECGVRQQDSLDIEICEQVQHALTFIRDHRFDPFEIYDEEFREDIQGIPDPKNDPLNILDEFLEVLRTMGPYCADRAALILLVHIEKLKVKTPYERHFLLLCMVSTVMIKIRAICEFTFQSYGEKERIYLFSSPKVVRLLDVLRQFKPERSDQDDNDGQHVAVEGLTNQINELTMNGQKVNASKNTPTPGINNASQNKASTVEPSVPAASENPISSKSDVDTKSNDVNGTQDPLGQDCLSDKQKDCVPAIVSVSDQSTSHTSNEGENEVSNNVPVEDKTPHNQTSSDSVPTFSASTTASDMRVMTRGNRGRVRGRGGRYPRKGQLDGNRSRAAHDLMDPDTLCGIVFVQKHFTAKILFYLLNEVRRYDEDLAYLGVQYTVEKTADPITEPRDAELEHRKQEEVLKRFRMHECNLLIATSVLEEGMDIPRCNLVLRFDEPQSYRSYVQSKGRARAADAHYVMLVEKHHSAEFVRRLAEFMEIEQVLLRKCAHREAPEEEESEADLYNSVIPPFCPSASRPAVENQPSAPVSATLNNAISLVNRYCAKLPSDTFTKLTPLWNVNKSEAPDGTTLYSCTLRLPINSPVKQIIIGPAVPFETLARRLTALETVRVLHESHELDDDLLPIGKESFRLANEETAGGLTPDELEEVNTAWDANEPRPGTTKRRQYYYKRVAEALTDCRPVAGSCALLYHVSMNLTCPLPEEQNTRGRRIYAPEDSPQGFGILTLKPIPKICPFPIFTRSGEVCVSLELSPAAVELKDEHMEKIVAFLNYTFTSVLRLQKYLMMFDPNAAENSYFIVPTRKNSKFTPAEVDWEFLDRIYDKRDLSPQPVSEDDRKKFLFEAVKYQDAVVMPWYRNQDQPQYFYVAEICTQLNPKSSFPSSEEYSSFEDYYLKKYSITIQNREQPLLDVDHTSARLNFLTPRYVNRKGVALPTSSEETKRAKRENLEQKQILVPELCTVHPFPASLWRKAVCLPCILYRINALLLADQIRCQVAREIGLGCEELVKDYEWEPLNFGWCLADVLKKSKESKVKDEDDDEEAAKDTDTENSQTIQLPVAETPKQVPKEKEDGEETDGEKSVEKKDGPWIEIGTWSNEMAVDPPPPELEFDEFDPSAALPGNVTMLQNLPGMSSSGWGSSGSGSGWGSPPLLQEQEETQTSGPQIVRYGSPTSWMSRQGPVLFSPEPCALSDSDITCSEDSDDDADTSSCNGGANGGLRIEFKNDNTAEAVEDERREASRKVAIVLDPQEQPWDWHKNEDLTYDEVGFDMTNRFEENIENNIEKIYKGGRFIASDQRYVIDRRAVDSSESNNAGTDPSKLRALPYILKGVTDATSTKAESMASSPGPGVLVPDSSDSGLSVDGSEDSETEFTEDEPENSTSQEPKFSFDSQPELDGHTGPSPAVILQALTMSNANDGINLERLETIGDSFLKYAITTYLYCTYDRIHEGKLSHLRSKQVSNLNLYRLGRRKVFGESMIATKFEPHDNWLPPCYYVPRDLEKALIEAGLPASHWNTADLPSLKDLTTEEIHQKVNQRKETLKLANINAESDSDDEDLPLSAAFAHKKLVQLQQQQQLEMLYRQQEEERKEKEKRADDGLNKREEVQQDEKQDKKDTGTKEIVSTEGSSARDKTPSNATSLALADIPNLMNLPCFIPYNLITQHSIPDKSIADCVEALIGAYLISCGPRGALLFMAWLGIQVLPREELTSADDSLMTQSKPQIRYGNLQPPRSPLLRHADNPEGELERLLDGFTTFEHQIRYRFRDRSYLLQALTHASYTPNHLTDCYQRLEFLGDAVLDYLITRHLYEDWRQHSPGALTDLRSALVNNTIFASLAVRFGFHKYFRHLSPGLNEVVDRFVRIQEENGHAISEEYYLIEEEECEEAEDVEVPKALGDVFESVAGAIFLDSGMSLDAVWRVYYRMMRSEIEQFSTNVPKSPIRELLELEPETAKFGKPEKLADGRRVRVTVEVFSKGTFKGIGRNYRIAKCTAAKCALKQLKKRGLISRKT